MRPRPVDSCRVKDRITSYNVCYTKLLRVRTINVRVIAATNRDLAKEVDAGRFRRDLYYRLNILAVKLPPLRERAEDAVHLLEHFVSFS